MEDIATEASGANSHSDTRAVNVAAAESSWDDNQAALSRLMSREGVFQLTQDLRQFSETLTSLKKVFFEEKEMLNQSLRVVAHERLGELLKVLKNVVNKYSELNSTGILSAAENLINHIKNFSYESVEEAVPPEIVGSINNLALAFSSSVSDCLIGDTNISPRRVVAVPPQSPFQRHSAAYDGPSDVTPTGSAVMDGSSVATSEVTTEASESSAENMDISFDRAKAWSKYANDLLAYVKKKAHIELEYAKQLTKLSQATRSALSEQSFLPFQSLYCTALDNDKEYASNVATMYQNAILAHKFIEPFQARKAEHDKLLKTVREAWRKDKRWLEEAEANLKKAKQQYQARILEYQKAKEATVKADQQQYSVFDGSNSRQGSGPGSGQLTHNNIGVGATLGIIPSNVTKVEKKRKQEDDSHLKATQAELHYRTCVEEANKRQKEVEKKEVNYMRHLRDMMTQCDQTAKAVTVNFFSLHCELVSPIRVQYQALLVESKNYEPGFQYAEYLRHVAPQHHIDTRPDYQFEPAVSDSLANAEHHNVAESSPMLVRATNTGQPLALRRTSQRGISDTESSSSRSLDDLSPSASPKVPANRKDVRKRRPSTEGSLSSDEILDDTKESVDQNRLSGSHSSKDFSSYPSESSPGLVRPQFQVPKVMKMVNKALKGMKRTSKATVFGVDFSVAAQDAVDGVPLLIKKCIAEIDNRALTTKGIYRVNGVKNRVEKLCSMLDSPQCARVDLSEQLPQDVSSVLKYFLRQLPEPLTLYRLFEEFLEVAKKYNKIRDGDKPADSAAASGDGAEVGVEPSPPSDPAEPEEYQVKLAAVLDTMRTIVEKLPTANFNTLQYIIGHLSRVSEHQSENKMSASNLAIIFGPTLLKPPPSTDGNELSTWLELPSQSQAIELMISHRSKIFVPHSRTVVDAEEENAGITNRTKPLNSVATEEIQSNDHRPDLASSQSASSLPVNPLFPTSSPIAATTDGPSPHFGEDTHTPVDSYSGSSTLPISDSFAPGQDSSTPRAVQKEITSGDSSLTGQSNCGMSPVDNDGRKVVSHSPRLKKSSSCEFQGGTPLVFVDGRRTAGSNISIGAPPFGTAPYPAHHRIGDGTAGPITAEPGWLWSTATDQGPAAAKGHPTPPPAKGDGITPNQKGVAEPPAVPVRNKFRNRFSKPQQEDLQSGFENPISSPHGPRGRHPFGLSRDKNDCTRTGDGSPRRASVAGPPKVETKSHLTKQQKRHSAVAGIGLSATSAAGRKLPQTPSTNTEPSSPVRSLPGPANMPGRTPPFNATNTWGFVKGNALDLDAPPSEGLGVRKQILREDDVEDVSHC